RIGNDPRLLNAYRVASVFGVIAVGVAGHFGGSLVHGETYLRDAVVYALGTQPASPAHSSPTESPGAPATITLASSGEPVDYVRDIEPILMKRCYKCHTGDEPEGQFSLSSLETALKGGESGKPAIVAGDAKASYLFHLVSSKDSSERMPPKGGPLEDAQIDLIRRWIDQGASFEKQVKPGEHWHWAYRHPVRHNPPAVKDAQWPRNAIDHFILAKVEAAGLTPSAEADRHTLIRRLWIDLTGLPPSPEEVDTFVNDTRGGAYERAVDRALASPHYGERWAKLWLDLARYADSHGYEKDQPRVMWPYRDWVISAFNDDMPFDQFTVEQLAGDELPSPTGSQLVATGFNRNTQTNEEGGTDIEEFRVDAVLDRTNTAGTVWLGSTVGCAQCHDHKNDPLTQKEYYQLLSIFNQDSIDVRRIDATEKVAAGAMIDYPRDAKFEELDALNRVIAELEAQASGRTPELAASQEAWERTVRAHESRWSVASMSRSHSEHGGEFTLQPDGSLTLSGALADRDVYTLEFKAPARTSALRLETLVDENSPAKGAGRAPNANFVLTDFAVFDLGSDPEGKSRLAIGLSRADYEQGNPSAGNEFYPIAHAFDDDARSGWAIDGQTRRPHKAIFRLAVPLAAETTLRVVLRQEFGGGHCIARPRISFADLDESGSLESITVPAKVLEAVVVDPAARTAEQSATIWNHYRTIAPELAEIREKLAAEERRRSELVVARALVMKHNDQPRQTHIFVRGSFLTPGEEVQPGTPSYLPPMPEGVPVTRLSFARWLVDEENPLTSRVMVNRLWEALMGHGIVETSDDFGPQGDAPTHPELLDWLAIELERNQWSLKQTIKTIVMSATYRQSSKVTPDHLAKDPQNKLYARAPRFRVEAETVRDIGLVASGLLTPTIGGPSVFPFQPDGTWTQIASSAQWVESTGADRYRRGMYTFWRRTSPYPSFMNFDAPSREITCTRRPRTNTPLQALTTLNDPAFVEMSAGLARRMMDEGGKTPQERAAYGMRVCVARTPTDAEVARLVQLYEQQLAAYRGDETMARDMASSGVAGKGMAYDPAEVSAWTIVANVLLNLDETVTRQ
ncbi:MAG TPA: PSD1 and planctomycete cytochrome C domain-containing protein, partial [Phycisphaerales bacterium]|nr:PSD1 and planctomycete cytochrome C domain-containing protein [Phycisphaerales bacterium]